MVWRWNFPFGLLFRGKSNVSLRENCKTDQSFESLDVSTCDNSDADLNTTDSTLLLLSAQVSELADDALAKHGSRGKWGPHTRVTWCFQSGCFLVGKTQNSKSPIPSSNDVRKKKTPHVRKKNLHTFGCWLKKRNGINRRTMQNWPAILSPWWLAAVVELYIWHKHQGPSNKKVRVLWDRFLLTKVEISSMRFPTCARVHQLLVWG